MCDYTFSSRRGILCAGLLLGVVFGCGGVDDAPVREYADVTGKVTYNGEALKKGKVMFQPGSGAMVIGEIQADGTYTLKGVIGANNVTIESRDEAGPMNADDPKSREMPKNHIPDKYATPDSGLTFEVKAGSNTANFDLK